MASKKKSPQKTVGGKKRKVGAVVMKRRGAKARLKNALRTSGKDAHGDAKDKNTGADGAQAKGTRVIKKHISRIKTKTKAITSKLTKPGGGRPRSK